MAASLRVCFLGVSHYHTPIYVEAALEAGLSVAGVSDLDARLAAALGHKLGCPSSADPADICDRAKPDFVVAFAPHSEMPALATFLIQRAVPFMMEKPCGTRPEQVASLAKAASDKGVFAAVPFVWRHTHIGSRVRRLLDEGDRLHYLSCRYIAGPPHRYLDNASGWMLDPAISGGGSTINLSVHFIDMFRWLLGTDPLVTAARMSNSRWGLPVEDESVLVLEGGEALCMVETGYHSCGQTGVADLLWSATTDREHMAAASLYELQADRFAGGSETVAVPHKAFPYYLELMEDVIGRLRRGERPAAGFDDMFAISRIVDSAYETAGHGSRSFPATQEVGSH